MRLDEIGQLPHANPVISTLFPHAPVSAYSGGVIRYYDQLAVTRGAAAVAEGATKPESVATWIERTLKIEKVADSIPVTKESLQDIFFIESEIRRLLQTNLSLKIDDLLYDGTGVSLKRGRIHERARFRYYSVCRHRGKRQYLRSDRHRRG